MITRRSADCGVMQDSDGRCAAWHYQLELLPGHYIVGLMMRLYHFTAPENVVPIQAEGLKPLLIPRDGVNPILPGGVVWFTRELAPPTWWDANPKPGTFWFCVEVVLPANDTRLVSFDRWLRQNHPDRPDFIDALDDRPGMSGWRSYYLYFGHVPPHRIKRVLELHVGGRSHVE
jgi:hypothetical protein